MADVTPEEILIGKLADAVSDLKAATQGLEHGRQANRNAIRWLAWAFTILSIGVTVIGIQVVSLAGQNEDRIKDIQTQRADSIRQACVDRNARNRVAVEFLRALPANPGSPKRTPEARERLVQGFTDALVGPVENCTLRVRKLVQE